MYEIFAEILRGYGLKTADVSRATGISMSTFTDWKKDVEHQKQTK